jgi:hypothetical protein
LGKYKGISQLILIEKLKAFICKKTTRLEKEIVDSKKSQD